MNEIPDMVLSLMRRAATEPYPAIPKGFRGRLALRPDLCIGCSLCALACPTSCIEMVASEADVPREGKIVHRKRRPQARLLDCIRCAACEEVCPTAPKAIYLSEEHSGAYATKGVIVT